MLEILDQVGVVVEDNEMLDRLGDFGGRVDRAGMRVSFAPSFIERFIAESDSFDAVEPFVEGRAHVYAGYYLDPETDEFEQWTVQTLLRYLKVTHYLGYVDGRISYAMATPGIPDEALVLYCNYLMLKFKGFGIASVNSIDWAQPILEMCEQAAAEMMRPVKDVSRFHVHMISPLKLGWEEARIYRFFADRGLKIGLGYMDSAGGTAPVTLAGAMAVGIAEAMFANMVKRAYHDDRELYLGCYISPLDMRSGMYACGRPEKELANIAMAQMARRYKARFHGHCGHSDAKRPSIEAGFQKALNSIPTLMVCGHTMISCGQISVDEVFSPIQLIIDDEIVGALQRFVRGFEINDDTLALDIIKQVGPGGNFLAEEHTASHFRSELWMPKMFSHDFFGGWRQSGAKTDADRAMDIFRDIIQRDPPPVHVSEQLERKLLDTVHKVSGFRASPVEAV
jgi:trimethylamine--corrinoid protein Co-methyltransferase